MSYTIQQSINFSQPFIEYSPLSAGTGLEPALSIANTVQQTVCGAPFTWPWNRAENNATSTVIGTQDYTLTLTDFAFLEMVSLTDVAGNIFEVKDIKNTNALSKSNTIQRPAAVCVKSVIFGTSVSLRFLGVPDAVYVITVTYQKLVVPMVALTGGTGTWLIPDSFIDVFNNLFLAEAFQSVDDARSQQYRQRGMAALLARAEGLSDMQKNNYLAQYLMRDIQTQLAQLRTTQASNARGI